MFGKAEREKAIKRVEENNNKLERLASKIVKKTDSLYSVRNMSDAQIKTYTQFINEFTATPKSFNTSLKAVNLNLSEYNDKQIKVEELLKEQPDSKGKAAIGGGIAIGGGVVALAPSAAMAIATTFGTASTGTAIASLGGAAATNAALAWLGGGAIAAGGGGMAAGNALLALAGPIGWGIAAVGVIGGGLLMRHSNLKQKEEADKTSAELETLIRKYKLIYYDIVELEEKTNEFVNILDKYHSMCNEYIRDYNSLNDFEKENLGTFVNLLKSSSELLNKEVRFIN